jgi:hypothetical protein
MHLIPLPQIALTSHRILWQECPLSDGFPLDVFTP